MPNLIENGFPIFTDVDGDPLEDGYIYIGVAGLNPLSNPLQAYWDSALTVPATNIRTSGGYPSNNGTPGRLYTESNYSILVQDKRQATVYTLLDSVDYFNSPGGQTVLKVDTVSDLRNVVPTDPNIQVSLGGYYVVGDGGSGPLRYWSTSSTEDDNGGSVIKPTTIDPLDPGRWLWEQPITVDFRWFGAKGDGVTDDTTIIQDALNLGFGDYYFSTGNYLIVTIRPIDDTKIEWSKDAWLISKEPIFQLLTLAANNLFMESPNIDGAGNKGLNGIGIGGDPSFTFTNIRVNNPNIKDCLREEDFSETFNGGGRGIMTENKISNVVVDNASVRGCTAGVAFQCALTKPTDRVIYSNPVLEECMHAMEFFDLPDQSSSPESGEMGGVLINGGYAINCGKGQDLYYSNILTANPETDTGVIIGERARWVTITGFKAHNDDAYGKVGAFWRGTGYHLHLIGCQMIGDVDAVVDITGSNNLLPIGGDDPLSNSAAEIASRDIIMDVAHSGALDYAYRCNSPQAVTTGHVGHKVNFNIYGSPTTGLIDVPSPRSDAYFRAFFVQTGLFVQGNFSIIVGKGNAEPTDNQNMIFDEQFYGEKTFNDGANFPSTAKFTTQFDIIGLSFAGATAGAGGALPATVEGYVSILVDGNVRKIPYYQV